MSTASRLPHTQSKLSIQYATSHTKKISRPSHSWICAFRHTLCVHIVVFSGTELSALFWTKLNVLLNLGAFYRLPLEGRQNGTRVYCGTKQGKLFEEAEDWLEGTENLHFPPFAPKKLCMEPSPKKPGWTPLLKDLFLRRQGDVLVSTRTLSRKSYQSLSSLRLVPSQIFFHVYTLWFPRI